MALENALLIADVAHRRMMPESKGFSYKVYYLAFSLSGKELMARLCLFSLNRFNLFSFFDRDHGYDKPDNSEAWIRDQLRQWDISEANGDITLVTMPRILGHVFNPVSFWFCHDKQANLRAVLAEVTNTFKERHCYLCFHDDHRPISEDDILTSHKVFHVSPFMDVEGYYQFRFIHRENRIAVWINYFNSQHQCLLTTSLIGKRYRLTSLRLLSCFFIYPMVTIKVITLIHYQALKLWCRRIGYRPKPLPPIQEISR